MKVTFFDTESTDLSASWGHLLCASFADLQPEDLAAWSKRQTTSPSSSSSSRRRLPSKRSDGAATRTFRLNKAAAMRADDSKLAVQVRDELERADIIVSWNGIFHDIPLVNARLALAGERLVNVPKHIDLYHYVSGRGGGHGMKIGSRSLDSSAKFFGTGNQKTPLDGKVWQLAAAGQVEALDKIVTHCEHDVLVLKEVFPHLAPQVKKFTFPFSAVWHLLLEI